MDITEGLLGEAITENLDIVQLFPFLLPKIFRIADLGCSVGPNTFTSVDNIIKSVCRKNKSLQFHVFFNDLISNDFNKLFGNLPTNRNYFASGVPGSFHHCLFPENFLHFVYSSYALQWLSGIPKELVDENSPSFNKGRVFYANASKEVVEAYSTRFADDVSLFLNARAHELVDGGLMAILIPCIPRDVSPSNCNIFVVFDLLGATLAEMVNLGLVSEATFDSFNLPLYSPTEEELKRLIKRNGCFGIEKIVRIQRRRNKVEDSVVEAYMSHLRDSWYDMMSQHFGNDIIEDLFDRYTSKAMNSSIFSESSKYEPLVELFVLLKRDNDNRLHDISILKDIDL